jgi:REP element-mobilizing transposase RayT
MPRCARMYLTGYPYHIVQRSNNREACFVEPENYPYYPARISHQAAWNTDSAWVL